MMRDVIGCTFSALVIVSPFLVAVAWHYYRDPEFRAMLRSCELCGARRFEDCAPDCYCPGCLEDWGA